MYTLFKPARKKYQRRKTIAPYSHFQHQADLADFSLLKKSNDGNQFLLIVIDVFSRFAYCEPVKSKKSTAVIQAFENIYRRAPNPVYLQTDRGTEFTNKALEKWLRQQNISLFQTYNFDTKAALAERLIRTLKTKLWRYFKANNTFKYIDVLDDLMFSYNNSYHRTIAKRFFFPAVCFISFKVFTRAASSLLIPQFSFLMMNSDDRSCRC